MNLHQKKEKRNTEQLRKKTQTDFKNVKKETQIMVEITYTYKRHPLDSSRKWKLVCFLWLFATRFVEKTKPTKQNGKNVFSGCKIQKKDNRYAAF